MYDPWTLTKVGISGEKRGTRWRGQKGEKMGQL